MEIRDLIIETASPKVSEKKTKAAPSEPTYEVAVCSGCDFAIRRKTPKTSRLLVIMPSQQLYYIKDENTGDIQKLRGLDSDLNQLNGFLTASADIPLECSWLKRLNRDAAKYAIIYVIRNPKYATMAKDGLLWFVEARWGSGLRAIDLRSDLNREVFKLIINWYRSHDTNANLCDDRVMCAALIQKYFGVNNAKDFVSKLMQTDDEDTNSVVYTLDDLLRCRTFEYKAFSEYIFDDLSWQGFTVSHGVRIWKDYLNMASQTGEKEKYPDNLFRAHAVVQRKYKLEKEAIDATSWAKSAEKMSNFEYTGSEFRIVSPKTPEDMVNEAAQQHNCLRSYIQRVIDGERMIFFLRRNSAPMKSLVTIEVYNDGHIGQVYAACNRTPDDDCENFVREWARVKSLEYNR